LRENGFKAIHSFGVAVLQEQEISDSKVGRNGVGLRGESASEGLAGFLSLVKVEQSVAKKHESGCVVGVLLSVRAQKRSGFGGFVLHAEMPGTSKDRIGGGVSLSEIPGLQSEEDQQQKDTIEAWTGHEIQL
jgi:hypothetical protein